MKTSKKLLAVVTSLLITGILSAMLAGGIVAFFAVPYGPVFWFFVAAQLGGYAAWEHFYVTKQSVDALNDYVKEYQQKPFKKYLLGLNCAHCGHQNEVEIDLNETEFRCPNCKKYNGVHVQFYTAAITEPLNTEL